MKESFGVAQWIQETNDGKVNVVEVADGDDDRIDARSSNTKVGDRVGLSRDRKGKYFKFTTTAKKDYTYLVLSYLCVFQYSVMKTMNTCSSMLRANIILSENKKKMLDQIERLDEKPIQIRDHHLETSTPPTLQNARDTWPVNGSNDKISFGDTKKSN
ncbi:hypothetical protein RFI_21514 [Reticulomyxa filosa]|uniref:Uncharacterized protein n=1 Tax=Reticulomyxa filosa TaxID=46433 RepID=X6MRX6_RETFI|nr:hypothetical protein RFI_21514 [Reticulomyxa filosa]|eukprot:ETO15850.1 hypothetical protein RFI_21514 [Reticulomyxa filosa]